MIMLSTNERELYLNDPLFHCLAEKLVALAVEHPEYAQEDGRRLNELVNVARAILEERRLLHVARGYRLERPADQENADLLLRALGLLRAPAQPVTESEGNG